MPLLEEAANIRKDADRERTNVGFLGDGTVTIDEFGASTGSSFIVFDVNHDDFPSCHLS